VKDVALSNGFFLIEDLDFKGTKVHLSAKLSPADCRAIVSELLQLDLDMNFARIWYEQSYGMLSDDQAIESYTRWRNQ
jgi:hypothetical protein